MRLINFGFAAVLAMASVAPMAVSVGAAHTIRSDREAVLTPKRRDSAARKRRDRWRAMGATYGRGDKLSRRVRRKFELYRNGAF